MKIDLRYTHQRKFPSALLVFPRTSCAINLSQFDLELILFRAKKTVGIVRWLLTIVLLNLPLLNPIFEAPTTQSRKYCVRKKNSIYFSKC